MSSGPAGWTEREILWLMCYSWARILTPFSDALVNACKIKACDSQTSERLITLVEEKNKTKHIWNMAWALYTAAFEGPLSCAGWHTSVMIFSSSSWACLSGDLCCATGLSNHWEAAIAERAWGVDTASVRHSRPLPLSLPPIALALGHWLVIHQDAPDRVTVELTRRQQEWI